MNLHSLFTTKAMSGRVQQARKFARAISAAYSVERGEGGLGQSFLQGSCVGLQSFKKDVDGVGLRNKHERVWT